MKKQFFNNSGKNKYSQINIVSGYNVKKYLLIKIKLLFILIITGIVSSCSFFGGDTPSLKLIPYKSGDKWGYIDKEGKILINPQFNYANLFINGIALVKSADDKYGYIGEDGKYKINAVYKYATFFSEGLACVVPENGKPQFIDEKGKIKFTVSTGEYCGVFSEGLAAVKVGDKWGFLDKNGKMKINPQFSSVYPFSNGLAAVYNYNKDNGVHSSSLIEQLKSDSVIKGGFINSKGEIVINYQFSRSFGFFDGLALVYDGKQYGYIDKSGKYIINPQFILASNFKNDFAIIYQGKMYGYIDKEGKIIINPQFKQAGYFSDDVAVVVSSDGKYGYIDKEGKYTINPQFEDATDFFDGIAFVESANKWGIIDKNGKYLVNPQFDKINANMEDYKYEIVETDYFDMVGIIQKFLSGTDSKNFMGFNTNNNTLKYIVDAGGGKDKFSINSTSAYYYPVEDFSKEVKITRIVYYFQSEGLKPVYRTVQRYDYWKGNYNVTEIDHYELDDNARLISAQYEIKFDAKTIDKQQIFMNTLADEIAKKLGVNLSNDGDNIYINNNEIEVSISKNTGIIYFSFIKYLMQIPNDDDDIPQTPR